MVFNISFTKEEKIEALEKLHSTIVACMSDSAELRAAEILNLAKLACSVRTAKEKLMKE